MAGALDAQSARRLVHQIDNPETAAAVNVLQPRRKAGIDDDPTRSADSVPCFGQCCRRCHGVDGAEKYRPASKALGKGISSSPCRRLAPGRDAIYENSLAKEARDLSRSVYRDLPAKKDAQSFLDFYI
jgi:hypothetical protein